MLSKAFWRGVEEFNQQKFYACHDTLEALWMEASEPHKKFYQGLLQIAVGCYHLSNFNWRGAVILLGEGIRKLSNYQPIYEDINVSQLLNESDQLLKALQQIEPDDIQKFVKKLDFSTNDNVDQPIDNNEFIYHLPKIRQ